MEIQQFDFDQDISWGSNLPDSISNTCPSQLATDAITSSFSHSSWRRLKSENVRSLSTLDPLWLNENGTKITDVDQDLDEEIYDKAKNALANLDILNLGDRSISNEEIDALAPLIQRILNLVTPTDQDTKAKKKEKIDWLEQLANFSAAQDPAAKKLLERDIEELRAANNTLVCAKGKSKGTMGKIGHKVAKFWKNHKKTIIITAAVVAAVATVAIVAVAVAGSGAATGVAAAGGAALSDHGSNGKPHPKPNPSLNPNPPRNPIPPISSQPPSLPAPMTDTPPMSYPFQTFDLTAFPGKMTFGESGVLCDGRFSSYDEMLNPSSRLETSWVNHWLNSAEQFKTEAIPISPNISSGTNSLQPTIVNNASPQAVEQGNETSLLPEKGSCRIPSSVPYKSHLRIAGINGINTTYEEASAHAKYMENFVPDHGIDWVYNRSHGTLIDLSEAFFLNYAGISPNTGQLLAENWIMFHEENVDRPQAKYLQFCHSQGAIHVRNTLEKVPNEVRDRIIVVAIAPAAIVPKKSCYDSFNYASKKDLVHIGELVHASALDPNECGTSKLLEMMLENHEELILLDPHSEATGLDHSFQSKTFEDTIKGHIREYLNKNGAF